jgi:predicted enzyme related to lactoylglutathione lyase
MKIKSICGVIIASENPKLLADFYSQVFDVRFEEENHGDLENHYGVDIGEVHLGIHPPENLEKSEIGNSSTSVAYNISSLEEVMSRLSKANAVQIHAPHDEGFGMVATYKNPEENQFEIVELNYESSCA